jgi:hypothetical protein
MVSVIALFALLHILSAIAWFGAGIFFVSVIGPGVKTFTPAASLEFLTKVGPRQVRFFAGSATATIVFGLVLLYLSFGASYTTWPTSLVIGFGLGLIAYLDLLFVAAPAFRKADHIARELVKNPSGGPPPPDFQRYLNRGRAGAGSTVAILFLATIFMVATGFPF